MVIAVVLESVDPKRMEAIPLMAQEVIQLLGACSFGVVIGWLLYYVNRHRTGTVQFSDLVTVIGAIGGGAVLALFPAGTVLFGAYGIGLAIGFFAYFARLNQLVRLSIQRNGAFDYEWFLDGRCKNPRSDQGVGGGHAMAAPPAGGAAGGDAPR